MAPSPRLRDYALSLRLSLGGTLVFVVALTSLTLGLILYVNMHIFIRNDLRARLRNAAGVAALQISPADLARIRTKSDETSTAYRHILGQLQAVRSRSRDVRFIYVFRKDKEGTVRSVVDAEQDPSQKSHVGEVYPYRTPSMLQVFDTPYAAHADKEFITDQRGRFISAYGPILGPDGRPVAAIGMSVTAEDHATFERKFVIEVLEIFLGITFVVILLSLGLTRRLSQPLSDLAHEMSYVQNFDLSDHVEIRSHIREVVQMKTALDNMKKGLRSFKRYVPSDLVSDLIQLGKEATLGGESRMLTIFFSDIAGFTPMSENMAPDQLADSLAIYFEGMTQTILKEGGTIDKFIGDAIMAFWGAPHPASDAAARACRAALRCQDFLDERFGRAKSDGSPLFGTRIGIHTGKAYVGNFGYSERLSYTAIGDDVNLASRLEGLNKHYGTRLLVSESTLAAAGDGFFARAIDRVAVKGRKAGILFYELGGEKARANPATLRFFGRFNEAMALYEKRRWTDAAKIFEQLSEERPTDKPAHVLLDRCRAFTANPPSADWDGIVALQAK